MTATLDERQIEALSQRFMSEILSDSPTKVLPDRPSCMVPIVSFLCGCAAFSIGAIAVGIFGLVLSAGSIALLNYFRAERLMRNIGQLQGMGMIVFVDRYGAIGARSPDAGIPSNAAAWAWSAERGWSLWGECKVAYYRTIAEAKGRK